MCPHPHHFPLCLVDRGLGRGKVFSACCPNQLDTKGRADAILVLTSSVLNTQRTQIVDLTVKNRVPAVYGQQEFVDARGLMAHGVHLPDVWRRAAIYMDRS